MVGKTLQHVQIARLWTLLILRAVSILLIVLGLVNLMPAIVQAIEFGTPFVFYGDGFSWIGAALGYLVPGIVLAFLAKRLLRWLVPVPRFECPQCGYMLRHLSSDQCPECGLNLGIANVTKQGLPGTATERRG